MNEPCLTNDQMYLMIVDLVLTCDSSLVEPEFLRQINIPLQFHQPLMSLRDHVRLLIENYNYLRSPVFQRSISGRSSEFGIMKAKLESEPRKRTNHARAFSEALTAIRRNDRVYDLLSPAQHHHLDAIQALIACFDEPYTPDL